MTNNPITERPVLPNCDSLRLLVADDDELVRAPLVAMLKLLKWDVVEASSGEAALKLARSNADFAAILLDYSMPGMNGKETLAAIRASGCQCPAILSSGYLSRAEDAGNESEFDGFLQKPFRFKDLQSVLTSVTGR